MRYPFIQRHTHQFPVRLMCQVLAVIPAGYYAWRQRKPSPRAVKRLHLAEQIRDVHEQSHGVYGSPRVHRELVARGVQVCENTVARVMKREQIRSKVKRKFRPATTDSGHGHPVADNLLDRRFGPQRLDGVWASDLTYIPSDQGWLYLAVVMDLCSRKIVGYALADHLRAELTCDTLRQAIDRRRPGRGLLHHSDRGVQYACRQYQDLLAAHHMTCSMSRKGNCYDNAPVESFFGTLKRELVHHHRWATREQAKAAIVAFIEVFYNRQRRHSAIGYQSPDSFEAGLN
jgi:putative transposase